MGKGTETSATSSRPPRANRTSIELRRQIRESPESLRTLARRLGLNPKTVAKWKARPDPEDRPPGPVPGQQRHLTPEEEDIIVGFRQRTSLPLDDCLYSLQARIPQLTRSTLYRCLRRHGLSGRLPGTSSREIAHRAAAEPPGCLHLGIDDAWTKEGLIHLFVAMDQASKYVFVHLARGTSGEEAAKFLASVAEVAPFPIREVLTPNSSQFSATRKSRPFSDWCSKHSVAHRLTTSRHPWTSRGLRRPSGTTAARYESVRRLADYLRVFVRAYNHSRRLKSLGGLTPQDFLKRRWQAHPEEFLRDPAIECSMEI